MRWMKPPTAQSLFIVAESCLSTACAPNWQQRWIVSRCLNHAGRDFCNLTTRPIASDGRSSPRGPLSIEFLDPSPQPLKLFRRPLNVEANTLARTRLRLWIANRAPILSKRFDQSIGVTLELSQFAVHIASKFSAEHVGIRNGWRKLCPTRRFSD